MTPLDPGERSQYIRRQLIRDGIFQGAEGSPSGERVWRLSPEPFWITPEEASFLERLGSLLFAFYQASNKLYDESVHGRRPGWVARYLDQGKPDGLVEYSRMNRMKGQLPGVIRPDILLTPEGMVVSELDAVPGGIGLTGSMGKIYSEIGFDVIGGGDGMVQGFSRMMTSLTTVQNPQIAVVVSDESRDYRPEMAYLCSSLQEIGCEAYLLEPREVRFQEEGLFFEREGKRYPIHILYRFFELFDLKNIPKAELILYAAKKKRVEMTPPCKPYLEEKMLFALFHHPLLRGFWKEELGTEGFETLFSLFPGTWLLDPAEMPPYGVIPDLTLGERPVASWGDLSGATQKERQFVIKPSGFSELAWGSRGLAIGQDLSSEAWGEALGRALQSFPTTPYLLQTFHKGRRVEMEYFSFETGEMARMEGRVRLCPYYFVEENGPEPRIRLRGILATVCSLEKKAIHGMVDAVMAPVAVHH